MISKEEYVLVRVKRLVERYSETKEPLKTSVFKELIAQWEFDYEMEKEYRPEVLRK
jgi:hypothetical protein